MIIFRRTRRHVTTPFIISLNVLDLIFSAVILPVYAFRFGNRKVLTVDHTKRTQTSLSRESPLEAGSGMCKFFPVLFYGTIGASMLSLTMVTINRAAMLFFPEKVDRVFTNNKEIRGHNVPVNRSEK